MKSNITFADVVIIGGGLSGTVAAFELAKHGHKVCLLRDGRGASPHVAGFNVPCCEEGDTVDCYIHDTYDSASGQADPALVDILCHGAKELPPYLESLGFTFDTTDGGALKARRALGSTYARVVGKGNSSGADILRLLDARLRDMEYVTVFDHTRAIRLLTEKDQITGVLVYDKTDERLSVMHTGCVLMACGGYGGIFPFTSNSRDISGDGIAMALLAGAHVTDMEFVQFEPSCAVSPAAIRGKGMITTLFYEGAVLTNARGERFMLNHSELGERVNKDVLAKCIAKELREGRGTKNGGVFFDCRRVNRERMLEAYAPFVKRYETVGIDLFKEPVEVANGAHTSLGGIHVDGNCETNIRGLFAIGEAMGHLHGANRIGGSAGTEVLVFPRHVATMIHHRLSEHRPLRPATFPATSKEAGVFLSPARRAELCATPSAMLDKHLGVGRKESGLLHAVGVIGGLYEEVLHGSFGEDDRSLYEQYSLENRLLTALALAKSALLRDDSVGCHIRLDQENPPRQIYRTDVCMKNGSLMAEKIFNKIQ